jgi:putative transposase
MSKPAQQRWPSRRSIRLNGYDYSSRGLYFVTICTHQKKCLLGTVVDGQAHLSAAGREVIRVWCELPQRFPGLVLDAFVAMPNHVHGVIAVVGAGLAPPADGAPFRTARGGRCALTKASFSLGDVVCAFKSLSAIAVNRALHRRGVPVWQRNYYEHIIRNGRSLTKIQRYIYDNPARWSVDPENPAEKQTSRFPRGTRSGPSEAWR